MKNILLLAIIICGLATTTPQTLAQPRVQTESVTLVETPTEQSPKELTTKRQFTEIFRAVMPTAVLMIINAVTTLIIQLL